MALITVLVGNADDQLPIETHVDVLSVIAHQQAEQQFTLDGLRPSPDCSFSWFAREHAEHGRTEFESFCREVGQTEDVIAAELREWDGASRPLAVVHRADILLDA